MNRRDRSSQRVAGSRRVIVTCVWLLSVAAILIVVLQRGDPSKNAGRDAETAELDAASQNAKPAPSTYPPGQTAAPQGKPKIGPVNAASLPFDLGAVMQQVHFAYHPGAKPGEFTAAHATYGVELASDAATLTLRPYKPIPRRSTRAHAASRDPRAPRKSTRHSKSIEGAPLRLREASIERGVRSRASQTLNTRNARARVERDGHLAIARGDVVEHLRNSAAGVEQSWEFAHRPHGTGDLSVHIRVEGQLFTRATEHGLHFADSRTGLGFRYGHGLWIDARGKKTPISARYVASTIELVVPESVLEATAYPAVLDPTISPEFGLNEPVIVPAKENQVQPKVASNGTEYFAVWKDARRSYYGDIYGARVTSTGVILDASGIVISGNGFDPSSPSVAWNGSSYLVAWEQRNDEEWDVYGARVDDSGTLLDPTSILISGAAYSQFTSSIASNGSDFLVVWTDTRNLDSDDIYDIYGTRIDSSGTVLDPTGIRISSGTTYQTMPCVASNGSGYFVAWQDQRSDSDIYGARVTNAGTVQDAGGIVISNGAKDQSTPSIASNGTDYFIAWLDNRNVSGYDVYGARVTGAGVLLDAAGIAIYHSGGYVRYSGVASNGTHYFVTWTADFGSGFSTLYWVYGARVSNTGAVQDANGILLSGQPNEPTNPSVASNGAEYFVVWADGLNFTVNEIYGKRVNATGTPLDPNEITVSTAANYQGLPSITSSDTNYLVAWMSEAGYYQNELYAAVVSSTGTLVDPSGILICDATKYPSHPAVASNGTDFFVAWQDGRRNDGTYIYGARVTSAGLLDDADGILVSIASPGYSASLASNGIDYFVAWDQRSLNDGSRDVYGARVSSEGMVQDSSGIPIGIGRNEQQRPSVASNGTDYLVAWTDNGNASTGRDVMAARVTPAGAVQDPNGITVSEPGTEGSRNDASAASNGADYFVVWSEYRDNATLSIDLYGARVASTGTVQDTSRILISSAAGIQDMPSVASNGAEYFVAWRDSRRNIPLVYEAYGTRVLDGSVESPAGILLAQGVNNTLKVTGALAPNAYVLAYSGFVASAPYHQYRALAKFIEFGPARGQSCVQDIDCESGHCTDDVCCDVPCDGGSLDCQACAIAAGAANNGICGAVTNGRTCDDGLACTLTDTCNAGSCQGAGDPCFNSTTCSEAAAAYSCSACPAGSYSEDGTGASECLTWTSCSGSQYESVAPTASRDRTCSALTICAAAEYESAAPTATSNRQCAALTQCTSVEFETSPPTPVQDRQCAQLGVCGQDQYETSPPTATTNRVCTPHTVCTQAEYQSQAPTTTSDRGCTTLTQCASLEFESTPPTAISNRVCSPVTECGELEFETTPPTATSDRICAPLGKCQPDQFESKPATATAAAVCTTLTICLSSEYQSTPPTATRDRVCTAVSNCAPNEYETSAPTAVADRTCKRVTQCGPGEFEAVPPTAARDRSCRPVSECDDDEVEVAPPTATSDRACAQRTKCDAGEFESIDGAPNGGGSCIALTQCSDDEYQMVAPTSTSDRVCQRLTMCNEGEYESSPATAIRDRSCKPCTKCDSGTQTRTSCSATQDTVCANNGEKSEGGCTVFRVGAARGASAARVIAFLGMLMLALAWRRLRV